jgi:hypothetical protein
MGLAFINKLNPVTYRWNNRQFYEEFDEKTQTTIHHKNDGSRKRSRMHPGLIAQSVKAVADELGFDFAGYKDSSLEEGGSDVKHLDYQAFISPLIKSIQELSTKLNKLEKENKYLYKKVKDQEYKLKHIEDNTMFESSSYNHSIL